jgi:hypothetical protein
MGSDLVKMRPCSIENSWSICPNRGSISCLTERDSGQLFRSGDDLFRVHCGLRLPISRSGFRDHASPVSPAPKNTVLINYFLKRTDLRAICSCNLAGSGWSRFLPPHFRSSGVRKAMERAAVACRLSHVGIWGLYDGFVQFFCIMFFCTGTPAAAPVSATRL